MSGLESVAFTVPGVPVPWQRSKQSGKRHYTAPEVTGHMERVAYTFQSAVADRAGTWALDGVYRLHLTFVLPDYKTRDWDNLAKLVSDALNTLAWHDDNQVMLGHVEKRVSPDLESCTGVTIVRLGPWPVRDRKAKGKRA